jgi:hypothetical protein
MLVPLDKLAEYDRQERIYQTALEDSDEYQDACAYMSDFIFGSCLTSLTIYLPDNQ